MQDIGLLDRVVACTKYCADVCPDVANGSRLIIADSWTAQSAEILAAKPDLVIASVPYQIEAVGEILKAGIRFLGLAPRTLVDIYTDIANISALMGVPHRGRQVVEAIQTKIAQVREACAGKAPQPRVFCEEWGKPLIASQPWVAELVEHAGGIFLGEPGKPTTPELVARCRARHSIGRLVRRRRSRSPRKARPTAPLDRIAGGKRRPSLLHSGRAPEHTRIEPRSRGLNAIAWALHPERFAQPPGIRQLVRPTGT